MNSLIKILAKSGLLKGDLDYHLVRASMVLIFLLFVRRLKRFTGYFLNWRTCSNRASRLAQE